MPDKTKFCRNILKNSFLCYIIKANNEISGCVIMTQMNFKIDTYGYSVEEVDKYIEMLQSEYNNAVQWGNEIERRLEEAAGSAEMYAENERLRKENEELLSDCKRLASKLKSLSSQPESSDQKKDYDADTAKVVNSVITAANKKAKEIVEEAYKTQDMIFAGRLAEAEKELETLERQKVQAQYDIERLKKEKEEIVEKLTSLLETL